MKPVIVALDFETQEQVFEFLDLFEGTPIFVKVGMELFYQSGADILKKIKDRGHSIFLDLKLHDIPNTVERAMRILAAHDIDMTTVHAAGGIEMMEAARRGLGPNTKLLAVTQLTSTSETQMQTQQGIPSSLQESVLNYAQCAMDAGCDGVISSPLEVPFLKSSLDLLSVTPGIRMSSDDAQDQKRITTPQQARANGADYIVVGRPITRAENPYEAYLEIVKNWEN